MSELPQVMIHTDGACSGNPGPGGWAALLQAGDRQRALQGYEADTTNNRMELMAAIVALETLKRPCRVDLFTGSQYLKQGLEQWLAGWRKKNFRTASGSPVKNQDLWIRLDEARGRHQLTLHWVRGHAGDPGNEEADRLAREALERGRGSR